MKNIVIGLISFLLVAFGLAIGYLTFKPVVVEVEVPYEVIKYIEVPYEVEIPPIIPDEVIVIKEVYVETIAPFPYEEYDYGVMAKNVGFTIGGYQVYDFESTLVGIVCEMVTEIKVYENDEFVWFDYLSGCNTYPEGVNYVYIEYNDILFPIEIAVEHDMITTTDLEEAGFNKVTVEEYYR